MPQAGGFAMPEQPPPYPGPPIQQYPGQQTNAQYSGDTNTQKMEYQTQPAYNPSAPN